MPGSYKELFENNEVVVRKLKRDCEVILICISRQNQAECSRKSVDRTQAIECAKAALKILEDIEDPCADSV